MSPVIQPSRTGSPRGRADLHHRFPAGPISSP